MMRRLLAWIAVMGLMLLFGGLPARAETPIAEFKSFRGTVNFTGTAETLRFKDNKQPCKLVNDNRMSAYLGGLPAGATVESAQLYWAASGATADYTIAVDGVAKSAPASRRYTASYVSGGYTLHYFSGAVDITDQVKKKGNGYYSFSGLDVNNGDPYCSAQTVVGGFALVVVYSHPNEAYRKLNIYEGFQHFSNSSVTIDLTGFTVPSPLPASATGRVGHITWEGDGTLSQGGEKLLFNGVELTDDYNPSGNQFNSMSNITGDTKSYGIDFDAYALTYPVIKAGDTKATTVYQSGQDLVLLNVEVLAMPYMATADLSVQVTRGGELALGGKVTYTIQVKNGGPDVESGPVTVVDALPKGMTLVSAAGSGWSCGSIVKSTGETVVTCSQNGPVASGAAMSSLVVTASPTAAGNLSNNVTVSGASKDSNLANNSVTDTSSVIDTGPSEFAFTARACVEGEEVVASDSGGCPKFFGPVTAGAADMPIYLTALRDSRYAKAPDATAAKDLSLQFALRCAPNSGVKGIYAGLGLDCGGAWSDVRSITFAKGQPSASLSNSSKFIYADVGRLTLSVKSSTSTATTSFTARPSKVAFMRVARVRDDYADANIAASDLAFAKAGEGFKLQLGALTADGKWAPSFGKEVDPAGTPVDLKVAVKVDAPADVDADTLVLPVAAGAANAFSTRVTDASGVGSLVNTAYWYEAGKVTLTPSLDAYLDTSGVAGNSRDIGRFYPDHFATEAQASFGCLPPMACPVNAIAGGKFIPGVDGATYSGQPFKVTVTAYGLARADSPDQPTILSRYANPPTAAKRADGTTPVASAVTLAFFDSQANTVTAAEATLPQSSAATPYPALQSDVTFKLPKPYQAGATAPRDWSAPRAIHLRASATDTIGELRNGVEAQTPVTITSANPKVNQADQTPLGTQAELEATQYESGLTVVAGRLLAPNVFGSELLRLTVAVTGQYWTGTRWVTNGNDDQSTVAASLKSVGCLKYFIAPEGGCRTLSVSGATTLTDGKGKFFITNPGRGRQGSVDYQAQSPAAPWLPSTQARATFGLYSSPLIYLREVY